MLKRELVVPSNWLALQLVAGAFVVGMLASAVERPQCDTPKVDIAKFSAQKLANEAFPQWQHEYGTGCPHSVYELTEFIEGVRSLDPWGNRYRMLCSNGRLVVVSTGEDGTPDTSDDLRSDQ